MLCILLYEVHCFAILLPILLLYEGDSAAIVPLILLYEAGSAAILPIIVLYEADAIPRVTRPLDASLAVYTASGAPTWTRHDR